MINNNTKIGTTYLRQDVVLYADASDGAMPLATLTNGMPITLGKVVERDGKKWVAVTTYDGRNGYVPGDSQVFTIKSVELVQPGVSVYESPSEYSRVLTNFKKGAKFTLIGTENNWVKIQKDQYLIGYIPAQTQIKVLTVGSKETAKKNMLVGALWCVGGTIATIVGASMASGGGTYLVFWGAIIFGAIQFFTGLGQYLKN
jgi:hypothetical protein